MAKTQARQEPAAEEPETWSGEEHADMEEAANDARSSTPPKSKLDMRHKIEDLIEARRLKKLIGDYDYLEIGEPSPRDSGDRPNRRVH